jgi:DNA-binding cell septation regulator SpoVG
MLDLRGRRAAGVAVVSAAACEPDDAVVASVALAPAVEEREGLLGWAVVRIANALVVDGVAIRRARDAERLFVRWPCRRARDGELHPVVAILDRQLRRRAEAAVLAAYLDTARRAGRRA